MSIATENALPGESDPGQYIISGAGDPANQGFCREFSLNVGEDAHFSCTGDGTVLDIYRMGYYGGAGLRHITRLTNTATAQPDGNVIPGSNGGITCSNWSTTATWSVPSNAQSGLYVGVLRNAALNNGSWIPFFVRNDDEEVDIIVKSSDATWALAYNHYGTPASPFSGKSVYGTSGGFDIANRCHYVSYLRPIVTRQNIRQTYWYACEYPLIRFLERNGYNVKYITCKDLDRDPSILDKGKIFISSGHDEYWSTPMRETVESWRDAGGGWSLFMSGNEAFWRIRFDETRDGMWCYKDTMTGPGPHVAGQPLDPVHWTGTWRDTRQPNYDSSYHGERHLTGTFFRMNGVNDRSPLISSATFGGHPVWAGTSLESSDLTLFGVVGFEADSMQPTQENAVVLAADDIVIDGLYADANGENYSGNGTLNWGIVAQRYTPDSGVVGFGTCQWSWALDGTHDRGSGASVSPSAQQFTVNLLADFGAQPETLMGSLNPRAPYSLDIYGEMEETDVPGLSIRAGDVELSAFLGDHRPLSVWMV